MSFDYQRKNAPKINKEGTSSKTHSLGKTKCISKENKPLKTNQPTRQHNVDGVAQKKLVLKPLNKQQVCKKITMKKLLVKPSPFITKANLYDEHWLKKQERGFTRWLNFILAPTDEFGNSLSTVGVAPKTDTINFEEDTSTVKNVSSVPLELLSKRRLLRWRQSIYCLFQSEPCNHVITRLEVEIEAGRILIHKDRRPHTDIGARQCLLDLLMSYNPVWLRLGLEAIFGELIEPSAYHDLSQVLTVYIQSRFLSNDDINERYKHPTLSGHFGDGYYEAQSQFIMKKFLHLVLLLDKAKLTRVIDHDPCLFNKEASFKTSRDVLLTFSNSFLAGEGDLTRHLHHMGYSVSHSQTPLDEFDYSVQNLAIDLQDGLRLTRLVELFTGNWGLSDQLRVPSATRMQRLHNVEIALKALSDSIPLPGGITAQNIVEGHRERTMNLIWAIIFNYQVKLNLNVTELKEEIAILSQMKPHPVTSLYSNSQSVGPVLESEVFFQSHELSGLLQWCKEIGRIYGVHVSNFSSSFSDGRLLCYIVHHYQPVLLPIHLINNSTTSTDSSPSIAEPVEETFNGGWVASFSPTTGRDRVKERLLANEKANYKLLSQKLPLLAGVPLMLLSKDMSNTLPDEKVVITSLSYLYHQLFLLKKETGAALVIQRAWRKQLNKKKQLELLVQEAIQQDTCANVIQTTFRSYMYRKRFLHYRHSACVIQCWWRRVLEARTIRTAYIEQRNAIIILQSHVRRLIVQRRLKSQSNAAVTIQAVYKCHLQRIHYTLLKQSVTTIQIHWRATLIARKCRKSFLNLRKAIITLQAHFRRKRVQRILNNKHKAATTIQSVFRCYRQRSSYLHLKQSVRTIENYWIATLQAKQCRQSYENVRQAIIILQSHARRRKVQQTIAHQRYCAVKIQAMFRCYMQRRRYIVMKNSVRIIEYYWQALILARIQRSAYLSQRKAIIVIQSHVRRLNVQKLIAYQSYSATRIQATFRMHIQRNKHLAVKNSVSVINCYWKATLTARRCREEYISLRQAAIVCQSHVRRVQVQRMINQWNRSAIIIQSLYRSYSQRKRYLELKHAVVVIQVQWRATLLSRRCREEYLSLRQAAIVCQSHVRRVQVQRMINQWNRSAIIIQSLYRSYSQRKRYLELKHAVVVIQVQWRATLLSRRCREEYLSLRQAAIVCQSHVRRVQVQRMINQWNRSAIIIQSLYRSYSQRKRYLELKHAVVVIQVQWRATLLSRRCREEYLSLRQAAIVCQSRVRRMQVQRMINHWNRSATIIQSLYRSYSQRKRYLELKQAVDVIQVQWRATLLSRQYREEYLEQKRAAITIQSHIRRRQVQRMIACQHRAATVIQASFKGYRQHKQYTTLRQSVRIIEQHWRATLICRQCRTTYLITRQAAITIQSHARRRNVQRMIGHQHRAATVIQACFRSYIQQRRFLLLKQKTIIIQYYWRATLLARWYRTQYLSYREAVITLQSHMRRHKVQRMLADQNMAAAKVQSVYRMYLQRKVYLKTKQSVRVIEKYWRATLLARHGRSLYLEQRQAVIKLQSHVRKWRVQKMIACQHKAALIIQSVYRCYSQRTKYTTIRVAVGVIQLYWRAALLGKQCRREYLYKRRAVISLQANARRMIVQRMLADQHKRALVIQAAFKGYVQRKRYLLLKQSVAVIEYYWRATLQSRQCKLSYLSLKKATVLLQSHVRRIRAQKVIAHQHRAATVIQSAFRCYMDKKHYSLFKHNAEVIQYHWRATLLARKQRAGYLKYRRAVIIIQSLVRKRAVQKMMRRQYRAAAIIQASFRCHAQLNIYLQWKQSVNIISYYWRATLLARHHRNNYLTLRQATVTLQAHYRRYAVQKNMTRKHVSATIIQASLKRSIQRRKYLSLKHSVQVIECYWSAVLVGRQRRTIYLKQRDAIVHLQAHVRRRNVQKMMTRRHLCATKIQSAFRCHVQQKQYLVVKRSVRVIEYYLKATLTARRCREEYLSLRQAAIVCQSHVRRMQIQRMINHWNRSATIIQSIYRSYSEYKRYLELKQAVDVIQVQWRATLLSRQCREQYLSLRQAVIICQSRVRRVQVQRMINQWNRSATIIQSLYQSYSQRKRYLELKQAVDVIQVQWRATLLSRRCREEYLSLRQAAIVCQSRVRRVQVQRMINQWNRSATIIQSLYRSYSQRKRYLELKHAVDVIQVQWRATLLSRQCREEYLEQKRTTITIQSHIRRKQVQRMIGHQHRAATVIQASFKGYRQHKQYTTLRQSVRIIEQHWRATLICRQCRTTYLITRQAAITIQSHVRRRQVQRMIAHQHRAATVIQASFRKYTSQKHYLSLKHSVTIIANYWQATLVARQHRNDYLILKRVTITMQSYIRRKRVEMMIRNQHRAATVIQAMYRCYIERRNYSMLCRSVNVLQCYWRATILARECRTEFIRQKRAITLLQTHVRRRQVQHMLSIQHRAATVIQAMYRCYSQRNTFVATRRSVCIIQYHWRATLASRRSRIAYLKTRKAILTIQSHFRRKQVQLQLTRQHHAATVIQTMYRCHVQRRWYLKLKSTVVVIQKLKRAKDVLRGLKEAKRLREMNDAAIVIQGYWRRYQEVHYYEKKINSCAIMIQSTWRGYRVRKRIRNKAINEARRRIQDANRSAKESNKLINKLSVLLDTLLQSRYLSTVGDILKSFELITSVSEQCSVTIVEGNALPVLYNFIGTSNRSRPTLEVVKICLSILNNITKWRATQLAVLSCNHDIVCLVDFMQKVYVTHSDIMLTAAILLHSYKKLHPENVFSVVCHRKIASMRSVLTRKIKMAAGHQRTCNHEHQLCLKYLNEIVL